MTPLYCSQGHENSSENQFCRFCGEKLPPGTPSGIGAGMLLGERYRIVRELGHGGFGRTYLAEDLNRFQEHCVLKEFAPQVQGTYALHKAEELFEREAGALYKLQHPQIPQFRELLRVKHEEKGLLFLVQDFVPGQTYRALLDGRLRQGLRFNEAEIIQLLLQILPVLDYIHRSGAIHRDISPDNLILRSTDGLPVLIDFGGVKQVAATVASQFTASSPGAPPLATRLGKVGYAPQEQMQGGLVYPHSDLYALGATVMVLLTGKEPQQLIDPHTLTWNWRQEVTLSPHLTGVLERMLHPRPSDRFASANQVLQALGAQPDPNPPPPPVQQAPPATEATLAIAPQPVAHPPTSPVVPAPTGTSDRNSGWLPKILLGGLALLVASGIGWGVGNLWINAQRDQQAGEPEPTTEPSVVLPTDDPEPEPSPQFSAEERQRKQALKQQRISLGIDYNFFVDLVNAAFWERYPELRGQKLGTRAEDAGLRKQWDAIAAEMLRKIERLNLTPRARQQLGSYGASDRDRFKQAANRLRLSSRALYDLADARFFQQFPQQQGEDFLGEPAGQLWQATVADTVTALQAGENYERLSFDTGSTSDRVSGSLSPGEGKALVAQLSAGQRMEVKLDTAQEVLFSLYSPTGEFRFLEDSRDRTWSGELPESGFYEFVIVSEASEPIDYQLELTVEAEASPEVSPESPDEEIEP